MIPSLTRLARYLSAFFGFGIGGSACDDLISVGGVVLPPGFASAGQASTDSLLQEERSDKVVRGKFMAPRAVCPVPDPAGTPCLVLLARHWLKMGRIAARLVVADVVQFHAVGNGSAPKLPRNPMGLLVVPAARTANGAIAIDLPAQVVEASGRRINRDIAVEAFGDRSAKARSVLGASFHI